jgi:transposase
MSDSRFVLTLPLLTTEQDDTILESRFEVARIYYNAILGEAVRRRKSFRQSSKFSAAVTELKNGKKKEANALFKEARLEAGYSEYSLEKFASKNRQFWISDHIDSHTCQSINTRVWLAIERIDKKLSKRVFFKRKNKDFLYSLEGRSYKSPLVFDFENKTIVWGKKVPLHKLVLKLHPQWKTDELAIKFFAQEKAERLKTNGKTLVKYCRVIRKKCSGNWRYLVQLVCVGNPISKDKHTKGTGVVAFDLGTQDIAVVHKNGQFSDHRFCEKLTSLKEICRKIRLLERKKSRQRHDNNPENFATDGTIKKGCKNWKKSNRQLKVEVSLAELQRKQSEYRKFLHGELTNYLRSLGDKIKFEDCSYKGWQASFGRSIGHTAPGALIGRIKNKFGEGNFFEFDTKKTKFSQRCPGCDSIKKKALSENEHVCEECGLKLPRDLASAILAYCVNEDYTIDREKVKQLLARTENVKVEE